MPPLPVDFDTVRVHGHYIDLAGTPLSGTVSFNVTAPFLVDAADLIVIMRRQLTATLDENGEFILYLPATDDPDISPTGFTYTVTEQFNGADGRTYSISVPLAARPDGVEIALVVPVVSQAGVVRAQLLSELSDVDLTDLVTGGILVRDSSGKWVAAPPPSATFAPKAGEFDFAGSVGIDRSVIPGDAPFVAFKAFARSWQNAVDVVNHGGGGDYVLAAHYDARQANDVVTTNASATITSALMAQFGPQDVGRGITGAGIPNGTTITAVASATSATMSATATASATVTAGIGSGGAVTDFVYACANGGNYASLGIGVTPPSKDIRLQVQGGGTGAASQAGIGIGQGAGNTADFLAMRDNAGTKKLYFDQYARVCSAGNSATDTVLTVLGTDGGLRPFTMQDTGSGIPWGFAFFGGGNIQFGYAGGAWIKFGPSSLTEVPVDFKHSGTNLGFYGTSPIAKQTGVAVTAAAVHAALVNLGLIAA